MLKQVPVLVIIQGRRRSLLVDIIEYPLSVECRRSVFTGSEAKRHCLGDDNKSETAGSFLMINKQNTAARILQMDTRRRSAA